MNETQPDESAGASYLFIPPSLDSVGSFRSTRLPAFTERHRIVLPQVGLTPFDRRHVDKMLAETGAAGVILGFGLGPGYMSTAQMRLARAVLRRQMRLFVYWPEEQAIEIVDPGRYRSFRKIWLAAQLYRFMIGPILRLPATARRVARGAFKLVVYALTRPQRLILGLAQVAKFVLQHGVADLSMASRTEQLKWAVHEGDLVARRAREVPFRLTEPPTPERPLSGIGVYLRTDYWNRITSGGSYGHTCYVANELSRTTDRLIALMAQPYPLLDELGIEQVALDAHSIWAEETDIVTANPHYSGMLNPFMHVARPQFIYERLVLGNYVGAKMSQAYGIPYFVEYNGSEISMRKSFVGEGYEHEDFYLRAEQAAFRQAAVISVVSEPIKEDLLRRGVPEHKILVNPNCVDVTQYAPLEGTERQKARQEIGLGEYESVIGFTGTFGGWHGIEVLAAAIPRILEALPTAAFLLIGDGNFKYQVDVAVAKHRLQDRVLLPGRVPQQEGARLLGICDLYVSPHSRHMVDSRFFGSPTKIFEYMAMGGGIVASDLEQIGEVLSPALRAADFKGGGPSVEGQRAVLCPPGDIDDFVDAVVGLGRNPEVAGKLGHNARRAAIDEYSWERHVEKLWEFASTLSRPATVVAAPSARTERRSSTSAEEPVTRPGRPATINSEPAPTEVSDAIFKTEAQNQWDNDPCGSHYVGEMPSRTLEWYLEAERFRYQEYAAWMPEVMEFGAHGSDRVLELGGGLGTDLAQFAQAGADVTDYDLSLGHLEHAQENFALRGLAGEFLHGDAEELPFPESSFDLVYSNGVIHHTPDTQRVVDEMHRVLRPGGKVIAMVYAEESLQYWLSLVANQGLRKKQLRLYSMGEIMSRQVELSNCDARPLVKIYTRDRLREIFGRFEHIEILQRQITEEPIPALLKRLPRWLKRRYGWNLIIKATKSE